MTLQIAENDDPRLPVRIRERLKIADERALLNARAIHERIGDERLAAFRARLEALTRSTDPIWIRLRALYQLVDEQMAFNQENTACRRGCAHCCHIAVAMLRPEAQMLGMQLKRKPRHMKGMRDFSDFDWGYHNPCTFLKDNECSIYEHRPMTCRTHFAMDSDATLCELDPPLAHRTPYLDTTAFHTAYVMICNSPHSADIREYFPPETKVNANGP